MADDWYRTIGLVAGWLCGVATFLGSWAYCAATYGFLFGFGLGWLPSIILAAIVGFLMRWLWGFALAGVLLILFVVMRH